MKSKTDYLKSLDDGRRIYANGERIQDLPEHPMFAATIELVGEGYDRHYDPSPEASGPYFAVPQDAGELKQMADMLMSWDLVTIMTAQGLLALLTAAARMESEHPEAAARIRRYFDLCRDQDLRCVQAITDGKGHRQLKPSQQPDPDAYTRIVERRADGIVIRGAKLHISAAAICHEIVIMPTKMMGPDETDWAVACAVPVNAPGVSIVNTSYAPRADGADFPFSSRDNVAEGFIILDDVFVPSERVFLAGETEYSATFAHSLGLWERLGGTAHLAEVADQLVGFARLIAEANGTEKISHIREKISEMVIYATLIRAGLEAAIANAKPNEQGWYFPDELFVNAAKHYGAAEFSHMVRHLHDIGGGAIVTAPSRGDFANPEIGDKLEKYMRTMDGVSGEYRSRLFHAIRDFTADAFGGWQHVTMLQSGGGLFAQRLVTSKHYDMQAAKNHALRIAGLDDRSEQ